MIGFAICGSFCTHGKTLEALRALAEKYDILPIVSNAVYTTDTRFGRAADFIAEVERVTGHRVISTVEDAEPLGPKLKPDALVVCPCTGNTLAKLACGITDTPVCMAVKAVARSDRPILLALASNDAMSANLRNIGTLLNRKSFYFLPMRQDDPALKPHSLVADLSRLPEALEAAGRGIQLRPLFL